MFARSENRCIHGGEGRICCIRSGRMLRLRNKHHNTRHSFASGTKSIGSMVLAHAAHAGHFTVESNISQFVPDLRPISPEAAEQSLQVKHDCDLDGRWYKCHLLARPRRLRASQQLRLSLSAEQKLKCKPTYPKSCPPTWRRRIVNQSQNTVFLLRSPGLNFIQLCKSSLDDGSAPASNRNELCRILCKAPIPCGRSPATDLA